MGSDIAVGARDGGHRLRRMTVTLKIPVVNGL
jgi:hypothetical protein